MKEAGFIIFTAFGLVKLSPAVSAVYQLMSAEDSRKFRQAVELLAKVRWQAGESVNGPLW